MINTSSSITRRTALGGALALGGGLALSACSGPTSDPGGPADPSGDSTGGQGGVVFPDHIPMSAAEPDIPQVHELSNRGYLSFPKDAVSAVDSKPLSGETINAMAQLQSPAPTPMENNVWWQAINDAIGGTLAMDLAPGAEYVTKVSTMLAGGEMPDLVQIPNGLPSRADALSARFTELSEYLGGNKVAEYSQLANLPENAWRGATYKGGIYGIPMPLGYVSSRVISREDLIKAQGLSSECNDADEFFELCTAITDVNSNRWALGESTIFSYLSEMFAVPNQWRVEGDTWTRDIETDEYVAALEYLTKLWDAGVIHPDAFGNINRTDLYKGGRILMMNSGGAGMVSTYNQFVEAAPDIEMGMPVAPKADGSGRARPLLGKGIYTLTSIPNTVEPDRVQTLLHVLNTLGAGFGTKEYLAVQFGAEGKTWVWDDDLGSPKVTEDASGLKIPVNYLPGCMAGGYFSAGFPEIVETAMNYEEQIFQEEPVLNPTIGLYSETEANENAALNSMLTDAVNAIVQGRRPLSEWSAVLDEWRSGGGDTIREEYAAAAAEAAAG